MTGLEIRAVHPHELESAASLIADVFAADHHKHHHALYALHTTAMPDRPGFDLADTRVAFLNGMPVALARVEKRALRYGSVRLKVAGIGDVCTHPEYRHQGYSEIVVRDALAYATEIGAHLVLLRDPGDYYQRYGFSSVLPDYALHYHADDILTIPPPQVYRLRPALMDDLAELDYLYEQHWSGRVAFSRSPALWRWRLQHNHIGRVMLVCNEQGDAEGYLWRHNFNRQQLEMIASTPEAMLRLMQLVAMQTPHQDIYLPIPPDDAIVAFSRLFLPVTLSASFHPESGWMARPVNIRRLLPALLPEIKDHLQNIAYLTDNITPLLDVRPEGIVIGLHNKPEMQCQLTQRDFIQVMFGTLRPAMLAQRTSIAREHVRMLEMLFPPRMAVLAAWDWF
ncbi:MAG: GNAT family N-acetyltransferase [Aggregatilineales bacterium]